MLIDILIFLSALAVLIYSSSFLIDSVILISEKHKIPNLFLGIFVIGFGSSLPEIFTSISSSFAMKKNIAIGNILGSNIANILLVLGISAVIADIKFSYKFFVKEYLLMVLVAIFSVLILWNGNVPFAASFFLLLSFILILFFLYKRSTILSFSTDKSFSVDSGSYKSSLSLIAIMALSLLFMPLSSYWMVVSGSDIARFFGLPEFLIGFFVIAIGTSLPEILSSVFAVKKKDFLLLIGNLIGSNIFNQTLSLSLIGFINSDFVDSYTPLVLINAFLVLLSSLFMLVFIVNRQGFVVINKLSGIALIVGYFCYCVYNFLY